MSDNANQKAIDRLQPAVRRLVDGYSDAARLSDAGVVAQLRAKRAAEVLAQAEAVDLRCTDRSLLDRCRRDLERDIERVVSSTADQVAPDAGDRQRRTIIIQDLCSQAAALVVAERRAIAWLRAFEVLEDLSRARTWWEVLALDGLKRRICR